MNNTTQQIDYIYFRKNTLFINNINIKPGEKFEFPLLMHEINVLPIELSWLI